MTKTERYADAIKVTFMQKVIADLEEHREGIHVSDLVYNCLRKAYFGKKFGKAIESLDSGVPVTGLTEREIMTFWIGKKIHELPITNLHETPLEYMGVTGTFDEALWINDDFIIIDKKTTGRLPSRPYEHHKKQIMFYALMYWKTKGIKANYGSVIYILKNTGMENDEIVRVFTFPITEKDYEKIEVEFVVKSTTLKNALEKDVPPPREPSFLCKYCPWQEMCFKTGVGDLELEGV